MKKLIYLLALFVSVLLNIIFMQKGIMNISQHLYYIPVLLGVFFFHKSGVYLAALTSLLYLLSVLPFDQDKVMLLPTIIRCIILMIITLLVYYLLCQNKEKEELIQREKKWWETTLKSIKDGIIVTDENGFIKMINREAESITGISQDQSLNKIMHEIYPLYHSSTNEPLPYQVSDLLVNPSLLTPDNEYAYITPCKKSKALDVRASSIRGNDNQILGYVVIFRDITQRRKIEEDNYYLTYHDKLTGLYNRRFFELEMERLDTQRNLPLSIIIGDVNGLKLTNDAFGHLAGDQLLIAAGNVMREVCRQDDIISRWGGDEYIILLPNTDYAQAEKVSERIRYNCQQTHVNTLNVSISLGCATKFSPEEDINQIIKQADDLMYKGKLLESKSIKNRAVQTILSTLHQTYEEEAFHSIRVSDLCAKLGTALQLEKSKIDDLKLLGTIHDIGKASIDVTILKKSELSKEEYLIFQQHSEKGYHIISASPDLSYLAEYVLSHHESFDGNGYPGKLKGDQIPYFSRILAVANAYDFLKHKKKFSQLLSKEEALSELLLRSGTELDPDLVEVFEKIVYPSLSS